MGNRCCPCFGHQDEGDVESLARSITLEAVTNARRTIDDKPPCCKTSPASCTLNTDQAASDNKNAQPPAKMRSCCQGDKPSCCKPTPAPHNTRKTHAASNDKYVQPSDKTSGCFQGSQDNALQAPTSSPTLLPTLSSQPLNAADGSDAKDSATAELVETGENYSYLVQQHVLAATAATTPSASSAVERHDSLLATSSRRQTVDGIRRTNIRHLARRRYRSSRNVIEYRVSRSYRRRPSCLTPCPLSVPPISPYSSVPSYSSVPFTHSPYLASSSIPPLASRPFESSLCKICHYWDGLAKKTCERQEYEQTQMTSSFGQNAPSASACAYVTQSFSLLS